MHSISIFAIATFTVLTAAAPHAHGHAHRHHLRSLAPRLQLSTDGSCGGDSGNTCGPGYCCSQWGYCGASDAYCGTGCQPEWGVCGSNDTTLTTGAATVTLSSTAASTSSAGSTSGDGQARNHPIPVTFSGEALSAPTTTSTTQVTELSTTTHQVTTTATSQLSPSPMESSPSAYNPPPVSTTSTPVAAAPATTFATSTMAAAPTTTAATASAAPAQSSTASSGGLGDVYKLYLGDGTTGAGWPAQSEWVDFTSMWNANMALISISCTQFGEPNNSDQESSDIQSAIQQVASSSGVDPRFILAIMMQESKGCVRAPTTNYGVVNPGLMQSHDGSGTCNNGGSVQNPCPQSAITQMITDGTSGTSSGDGLKQCISESKATDVSMYYKAARIYNSGSIASSGNLQDGIATHCYASDIANRLTGWVKAATACTLD